MIISNIPRCALLAIERLQSKGYQAYIVGGAVRDSLLGQKPQDWDISTSALPVEVESIFSDCKTIPTGKEHGTITVLVPDESNTSRMVEITTFRKDDVYFDGRRPSRVEFVDDIVGDLSRRDFTINAMAYNPTSNELIDPFGGREHLEMGIISFVGDAKKRIIEDPLRMMRAIRFATKYQFAICATSGHAIWNYSYMLNRVSIERINDELAKMMLGEFPGDSLSRLSEYQILELILPMHKLSLHQEQTFPHTESVLGHSVDVVANLGGCGNLPLLLAGLFHDVAKPLCASQDDRGIHFYGHAQISSQIARHELRRLRFSNDTVDRVVFLVRNHMFDENMKDRGIRRLIERANFNWGLIDDLFELKKADLKSMHPDFLAAKKEQIENLYEKVKSFKHKKILHVRDLPINGNDIIQYFDIKPSKEIGQALKSALEYSFDAPRSKSEILRHLEQNQVQWRG